MARPRTDRDREDRELVALRQIREAIRALRHGTVTVFVQDGVVVQIDRTEKMRLDYSREGSRGDGEGI